MAKLKCPLQQSLTNLFFVCCCSAGDFGAKDPPDMVYTEDCWSRIDTTEHAYNRAKTLTEMAAWNFLAQVPGIIGLCDYYVGNCVNIMAIVLLSVADRSILSLHFNVYYIDAFN